MTGVPSPLSNLRRPASPDDVPELLRDWLGRLVVVLLLPCLPPLLLLLLLPWLPLLLLLPEGAISRR